jgi:hypothetical protein
MVFSVPVSDMELAWHMLRLRLRATSSHANLQMLRAKV